MAMNPNDLTFVCDLVRRRSGIDLDSAKEYLVEARLLPLSRKLGLASLDMLLTKLKQRDAAIERDAVDAMTTNETSFFRDIHPFEALKKSILPELIARRAGEKRLNIWCAASSTGQEPYTIAMLLRENFPQLASWSVTFIASDLSRDVLKRAKAGRFSQLEVSRGLPAPLLVKYFTKQGLEWEIAPALREMIDFREINLLEPWPSMPLLDVVFIRNVLIYFSTETKKPILERIRSRMRPDGALFLGVAESTMNVDEHFVRAPQEKSGCFQIKSVARAAA
ncbi:MAG: CheR family methyltransferase [Tepidisphaeraceae bacterium]